jgi:hypothetical protein
MARPVAHPLLQQVSNVIKAEYDNPAPIWDPCLPTKEDLELVKKECITKSEFDPLELRLNMWNAFEDDIATMYCFDNEYGKLVCFMEDVSQIRDLPLDLWGRILRTFYNKKKEQVKFRIFFLADTTLRKMNSKIEPIGPANINGGYTYRCHPDTIIIYRAEDATRVLLHELFHACCCDNPDFGVDIMEAETEAWAELLYCAWLSRGTIHILLDLIKRQSDYMNKQNKKIAKRIGKKGVENKEFPWRYTIGKQDVWERWGIFNPVELTPKIDVGRSLRLTFPPSITIKKREGIRDESTIL